MDVVEVPITCNQILKGDHMKKGIVASMCFTILILLCAVPTHAWQGRMAGMGGVYGLVEDESDFLTHPAGIANGQGLNFYGNMMLGLRTTDKVKFSTYSYEASDPDDFWGTDSEASGREFRYEGLFGGAFPVGTGRVGIFLQYSGLNGSLRGDTVENNEGDIDAYPYDTKNKLDALALRVLYGVPVSKNLKAGAEFQIAYKKDKNKTKITDVNNGFTMINAVYGFEDEEFSLLALGVPYDSRYYEASMKASVETLIGPAKASLTLRGGLPFSTKNKYYYEELYSNGYFGGGDHDGKVKGHNFGADAWLRMPLNNSLALPFVVKFDYAKMNRKAEGQGMGGWDDYYERHTYQDKSLTITAGGGIDYSPNKGTRIAGGLYYTYLKDTVDFTYMYTNYPNVGSYWSWHGHDGYPETREHRISFKAAVEKIVSTDLALNGGFNAFYGRIKQNNDYSYRGTNDTEIYDFSSSVKGNRWGIGASLSASIKAGATIMEPYITGGFERFKVSGDGARYEDGVLDVVFSDLRMNKKTWFIGAGLAIRF